ncbi:flagellar rod assembly protein/muramidase FlgJ [Thioalkalivibrio sulfidiphilus HL-EbGr7]|uniref:Peptidoglycan hydrolase FlgJ n=1 Tax=Thioalkalivibrio sulfidiphilus (strain HL-EbGR7) TaxID=396588 RepID=B8GQB6_THISH|nr:flagellar assembly peptidoglycan hydrolase FlgJ [Thioalkalivibrio sulfidiphilus]ACL72311.1 flagellar rod assembly protein/muramidase FlgJ [Thioalkalivibrio sulfidiphilus HL-EbGr7]
MNTDLSKAYTYTDFQGFSDLRRLAREESPEAAEAAARQFEALFIQMMLKSMRDAMPVDSGMDGDQVKFYQGMFDQQIALEMSRGEGIGLRESLLRQLNPEAPLASSGDGELPMPVHRLPVYQRPENPWPQSRVEAPASAAAPAAADDASGLPRDWRPESPEAFIRDLWPHAERAGQALGVAPEVLLAQSALETGWGRHMIPNADGSNSFNLFGIKADNRWDGPRAHVQTLEYVGGVPERQRAAFRAYEHPGQSFDDYVAFITGNPRYREALARVPEAEGYLRGLQAAGYATDPAYADKILDILGRGSLQAVVALKNSDQAPIS